MNFIVKRNYDSTRINFTIDKFIRNIYYRECNNIKLQLITFKFIRNISFV